MGSLEQKSSKNNRKNDERKTYDEIKIFFSFDGGSGLSKMTLLYHRSTSGFNTSVTTISVGAISSCVASSALTIPSWYGGSI
jgi:hypothetical protein